MDGLHAQPTVLVQGASGNTGSRIARLLLAEHPGVQVVAAGRRRAPLETLAAELGPRCTVRPLDASDGDALTSALADVDLLVAASSTSAFVEATLSAAGSSG